MRILESRFCSLSRAKDFQAFLKNLDSELYQLLINHLQLNEGCKSNSEKMKSIYLNIKSRGKENELISFMLDRYPHMVARGKKKKNVREEPNKQIKVKRLAAATTDELYDKMNYHKVFDVYRPKVLFIPQRKIIVGPNKDYVVNAINKFLSGKIDTDYIVLEGPEFWHGYVEYFDIRFRNSVKSLDHSRRPIARYRKNVSSR